MEEWQLDFEYLRIRHWVKDHMQQETLPDLNTILFLIGIQELGRWKKDFTKEEKRDLMHIAVCRLLSYDEYYEFVGRDEDGWPHYRQIREMSKAGLDDQEKLLKKFVIRYFDELREEEASE